MPSTLAPPTSAAKRYSNLFRSSRNSMLPGQTNNNDDLSAPSYFDDLAFLDESGGLGTTSSPKGNKNRLRPLRKSKEKTHGSKPSASGFLRKGARRSSAGRGSKAPSITTTTTTTFVEYPYYEATPEKPSIDLPSIADSEVDFYHSPPVATTQDNSDSDGGGGFFNDLAFLEAQEEVVVQPKSPKIRTLQLSPVIRSTASLGKLKSSIGSASPKSSSSSTFARFRTSYSAGDSVRSRTTSLQSSISTSTLTNPSIAPRTSQLVSPISPISPNLFSPPPSLTTHSSSPSLSSTMLSSPSAASRHESMQFNSAKGLPALPLDFSLPEGDTPRAATFGRDPSSSPRPSAQYIFDTPAASPSFEYAERAGAKYSPEPSSPKRPAKFPSLDLPPRSPRQQLSSSPTSPSSPQLPSGLQRDFTGGPIPPPKHSRQQSANYQVQSELTGARPLRHSSLAAAAAASISAAAPISERLNRASLSAVLAREEKERSSLESRRSSRSSPASGSSPVSPTAEDLALLPTFSHLALASASASGVPPVPPVPAGLVPPPCGHRRRSFRASNASMDGGPTSPCHSIIAAFPTPPEASPPSPLDEAVGGEGGAGHSHSLIRTLAQMHSQFYPHLPPLNHPDWLRLPSALPSHVGSGSVEQDVRPESDAFSFDDDYWLATPSAPGTSIERREGSCLIPHPLRLVQTSAAVGPNGSTTPTTPTLLTPELMYPATVTPSLPLPNDSTVTYRKSKNTSSLDSSTFDINSLIEHARPESATLPDFVNIDREGSLRSAPSTHVQPSEDGTDEYNEDHEEVLTYASESEGVLEVPQDGQSPENEGHVPTVVINQNPPSGDDGLLKVNEAEDSEAPRADTPTSQAARMDAFFALESLASAAGYRLVRASYVPPREPVDGSTPEATTPTTPTTPTTSTPLDQAAALAGHP